MRIENVDLFELEKKYVIRDFPLNIAIEVGNYCNLNCIMCTNKTLKRKRGFMDMALYKKIVDEIAEKSPQSRVWLDFYGEPLIAKYTLYYMIDYAKKKGLGNICLNTNGTLLNLEMADMLLDSGIDFVSIDVDGYSAEVFEKIRVGAKRDVVYDNIEKFLLRKKERGCEKPIIEIKAIEMPENEHEIDRIINYWSGKGAKINVRKLYTWAGGIEENNEKRFENRIACGFAIGQLVIAWDGSVAICGSDCEVEVKCGDINQQTLEEVWDEKKNKYIKLHMEHRFEELPLLCQNCIDWSLIGEIRLDEEGKKYNKNYDINKKMIE